MMTASRFFSAFNILWKSVWMLGLPNFFSRGCPRQLDHLSSTSQSATIFAPHWMLP